MHNGLESYSVTMCFEDSWNYKPSYPRAPGPPPEKTACQGGLATEPEEMGRSEPLTHPKHQHVP